MKLAFIKTLTLTAALSVSHLATASLITDHGTSGVANNGTLVGTTSLTTNSKYGSHALHSTGAGTLDGLYIGGDLTDLDQVGDFAAMAWVNVNNLQGGNGILTLGSCCNTRNGYTLNLRSNGVLRFWGGLDANNTNYNAYSSSSISDNQWHHVGVRVTSGGLLELLVDGIVEASINYGLSTSPSQSDFANSTVDSPSPTVGGDGISSKNESDLYIDEVRVYSSYLDDAAWRDAMNGVGFADQLHYNFDSTTSVPEPSTIAIVALGLFGLSARRMKKAK